MKNLFFVGLFYFFSYSLIAQRNSTQQEVDSLLEKSFTLLQENVDSSILLSKQALKKAQSINYELGYVNSYTRLSIALRFKGLYDLALEKADSALFLDQGKYEKVAASAYNNKGVCYRMKGDYEEALTNYLKAIEIYSRRKDTLDEATVLNSVGVMFMYSDFPKKALQYYKEAEALQLQINNKKGLADVYNNYAITYANAEELDQSLLYFQKSLDIEEGLGNKRGVIESYGNIGIIKFMQGEVEEAIAITEKSIEVEREMGNLQGEIASYNTIAEMLNEVGQPERALTYLQKTLAVAKRIDSHQEIATAHLNMADSYRRMQQFEKALNHYIQFHNEEDSAKSFAQQNTLAALEAKFQTKEKEQVIQIQDLSLQEKEANLRLKSAQNVALVTLVIALIIIITLFYFNYKNKKQKELDAAVILEQEKGIHAVFQAQEEERKRISKDLHDGVGQQLSGIKMAFHRIAKNIQAQNPDQKEEMDQLGEVIAESADEVRSISHQMMPRVLTEVGLIEAIQGMLEKSLKLSGIHFEFEHFGIEKRLPEKIEIGLYRVCQELINNIIKHSEARNVNVQLLKNPKYLILLVEDDGKGIKPEESKGHGLLNMKSRVNTLKGEMNLEPSPSSGTLATVRIPLV